jgi:hypothetical protein
MPTPLPRATTPATVAAACLAAAFLPAVPAAASRAAAPAESRAGTLSLCQAMTAKKSGSAAFWHFTVTSKETSRVVARGHVPSGTKGSPACRAIVLPAGSYTVAETPKAGRPVAKIVGRDAAGTARTHKPAGRALNKVGFGVTDLGTTTVTFFNRRG